MNEEFEERIVELVREAYWEQVFDSDDNPTVFDQFCVEYEPKTMNYRLLLMLDGDGFWYDISNDEESLEVNIRNIVDKFYHAWR